MSKGSYKIVKFFFVNDFFEACYQHIKSSPLPGSMRKLFEEQEVLRNQKMPFS